MGHPNKDLSVNVFGNVMIERRKYLGVFLDELHINRSRRVNGKIRQMLVNGKGIPVLLGTGGFPERERAGEDTIRSTSLSPAK